MNMIRSALILFSVAVWLVACSSPQPVNLPPSPPPATMTPPALPGELVISVLPFEDRTKQPAFAWMRKGVADLLVGELARLQHVTVVQRDRLEEVVREQSLQLSGRVDEASAVRVGRLTGASVLLVGSMAVAGTTLRLDVQLIGVERGVVLDTASAEGPTSDPLGVAKSLTTAVLSRLHAAPTQRYLDPTVSKGLAEAVMANDAGETHARAGKLFQALEEYERSMGTQAGYGPARSNYNATVKVLSGRELTKDFQIEEVRDRRRVAVRLVDRLMMGGLKAEVGRMKLEAGEDGLVAVVPVAFTTDPATIDAVSEMTVRMGGAVDRRDTPSERMILDFTQAASVGRDVTKLLAGPRRAFLRLLGADGRPIAVVSGLQEWRLSRWITVADDIHVVIAKAHRADVTARVGGLTEEEVARIARAEVIVEPVTHERALVRVEYANEMAGAPVEREALVYRPGQRTEPTRPKSSKGDEPGSKSGDLLQKIIANQWNPPITSHGPGSKVLPGNLRTVAVGMTIEESGDVMTPPRLLNGSGEALFDDMALEAVVAAIPQWMRARQDTKPIAGSPRFVDRPGPVRITFQLVKDLPPSNVVSALASTQTLSRDGQPLSSNPTADSPR